MNAIWKAIRNSLPPLLIAAAVAVACLAAVLIIKPGTGQVFSYFTREPAYIAGLSPLAGVLSNVGILIWFATVPLCLLAARLDSNNRSFYLASAILTLWLVIDDMFMFHDYVFPSVLGISETLVYGSYVIAVLVYLAVFGRQILAGPFFPIIGVAFMAFGLSVLTDLVAPRSFGSRHFIEDGVKFFGIVCWTTYFWMVAVDTKRISQT